MILLTNSEKRLQIRFKGLSQSPSSRSSVTEVKLWRHDVAHPISKITGIWAGNYNN
jgi:hypothetical protein